MLTRLGFSFLLPYLQNIIKKVIGQKFVYKFVSFPEILKMDPAVVESGRSGEEVGGTTSEPEAEEEDRTDRNQYRHSNLYSSFTISSLQHALDQQRPIKQEPRCEESSSVIRFVTNGGHSSLPPTPPPSMTDSPNSSVLSPRLAISSSPSQSPAHIRARGQSLSADTEDVECSAQPLNLSSGQREREKLRCTRTPERRGLANSNPSKGRKPKGLEISASPLLLTGSDLVSIALNSPALPSGSLTPAFLTTQVRIDIMQPLTPPNLPKLPLEAQSVIGSRQRRGRRHFWCGKSDREGTERGERKEKEEGKEDWGGF